MDVKLLKATPNPEELICVAARNDYKSGWVGDETFEEVIAPVEGDDVEEKKRNFLRRLLKHGHFGPFEHPSMTVAIEGVSRACMAHITRHRLASFDVQSMRYVSFDDVDPAAVGDGEMVVVPPSVTDADWVGRNQKHVDDPRVEERKRVYVKTVRQAVEGYQRLLDLGVPPEDARMTLPIGTKVNIVMTLNARMLMHVGDMRAAADSQWEVRSMTESILELAEEWCPVTFEYYNEEMKNRKNRLAP